MNKYVVVLKMSFERAVEYRFRAFAWIIIDLIFPTILSIVFATVVDPKQRIFGFSRSDFILYFMLVGFFRSIVNTHNEENVNKHIKEGKISNFLTKPISYFLFSFCTQVGWNLHKLLLNVPVFVLWFYIFSRFVRLDLEFSVSMLALPVLVVPALLCDFCYTSALSMVSFWLIESFSVFNLSSAVVYVLAGSLMPIDLLPTPLQRLSYVLPFQHIIYSPVKYSLGLLAPESFFASLLNLGIWSCAFFLIYEILWKKGLKVYEGLGL